MQMLEEYRTKSYRHHLRPPVDANLIKDETAIVGIGQTTYSRDAQRDELDLACEAIKKAVADAGLEMKDIDGLEALTLDRVSMPTLIGALGIKNLRFTSEVSFGGGGACALVMHAAAAVATGAADYVVCYRALNEASGHRYGRGDGYAEYLKAAPTLHYGYYFPYGFLTPLSWAAMYTKRWMHEYGIKLEDTGWYSVVLREYAQNNPDAIFYGKPLTIEEFHESPMISAPLRLYDCCVDTDGAAALVVTTADRAKDMPHTPVHIAAAAQSSPIETEIQTSYNRPVVAGLPETWYVGQELYRQSGLGPADIDVAQLYDPFSYGAMIQLEELGFCGPGECVDFCYGGDRIRVDGDLPLNTSGGLLSEAYIHGVNLITEAVRQLRGTANNQVADAETAIVTAGPGLPTSGLILRK